MEDKNLILILAMGGSQSISRHNLRLVNNKPLLYYILKKSLDSKMGDVYVSTDSKEIQEVTRLYGGKVIPRPTSLTKNSTTLEEIINHALTFLIKSGQNYQKCLVVSPIFPLLKVSSIKKFFVTISGNVKTVYGFARERNSIYAIDRDINRNLTLLSKKQTKVANLLKVMAFDCKTFLNKNKFDEPIYGIEISSKEWIPINNYHDLFTIEEIIKRRKILVRVDGDRKLGLGHVYNMLTILNQFRKDDILIVMHSKRKLGDYKFKGQLYKVVYFSDRKQLEKIIEEFKPDIVMNDILNTQASYIKDIKKKGCFVVNFEDIGDGSKLADLMFSPIYDAKSTEKKKFGSSYACVRDEFRIWENNSQKKNHTILITFGGSDIRNMTLRTLKIIQKYELRNFKIQVILGSGFSNTLSIKKLANKMIKTGFIIKLEENSSIMAKHILDSDFVFSSNGRTVFEIASLKTPFITISANPREEKHVFSRLSGGGIHLGLYSQVTDEKIKNAIKQMLNPSVRRKFINNLKKV